MAEKEINIYKALNETKIPDEAIDFPVLKERKEEWADVVNLPELKESDLIFCLESEVVLAIFEGRDKALVTCRQDVDDETIRWVTADSEGWNVTGKVMMWRYLPPDPVMEKTAEARPKQSEVSEVKYQVFVQSMCGNQRRTIIDRGLTAGEARDIKKYPAGKHKDGNGEWFTYGYSIEHNPKDPKLSLINRSGDKGPSL